MKMKINFLLFIIFISLFSQNKFNIIINNNTESKATLNYDFLKNVFESYFEECFEDIENMSPNNTGRNSLSEYPILFQHLGLHINSLPDEKECTESLVNGTFYVIAMIRRDNFYNKDDRILLEFLDLYDFCIGGCATAKCEKYLTDFARTFGSFSLSDKSSTSSNEKVNNKTDFVKLEEDDIKPFYEDVKRIFIAFLLYILFKLVIGTIRFIYIPKGYDIYVKKLLNERNIFFNDKNEKMPIVPEDNNELIEKEENIVEYSYTGEYNPLYDNTSDFPLYLRLVRFLDLLNDIMLLTSTRNRYYNDNGLEVINFLRVITLYFYIFSNIFTTILALPSKDILNKAFFASNSLFFYRFSTHSITCWIFLEGAYTAYKLMKFIKIQINIYNKNKKRRYNIFSINLIIIYGKFILLFIPKICIFLFCYYIFYTDIFKFAKLFSAQATFKYVVNKVITKDIICSNQTSYIFSNFYSFDNNASNFKTCYDFTYVYINILFCSLCLLITIYIILLFKKELIEIFFMVFYSVFCFGLIFTVRDKQMETENENKNKNKIYSYYHFKGQEYLYKISYLSLGVYFLGFIFGILCFNYDNIKTELKNKDLENSKISLNKSIKFDPKINSDNISSSSKDKNNENILEQKPYYPFSFLNGILKWLKKKKYRFKIIIIFICVLLQIFLSAFFKIYGWITKDNEKNQRKKENDENYDRNYVLEMDFDNVLKGYFLFEKHIFLLLFFIISLLLVTFRKKGLFKQIIRSKLINSISRVGFLIICLSYILNNFIFCVFLLKIKLDIPIFIIFSIGNFLIIFVFCILVHITFELPIRMIIKKILRII